MFENLLLTLLAGGWTAAGYCCGYCWLAGRRLRPTAGCRPHTDVENRVAVLAHAQSKVPEDDFRQQAVFGQTLLNAICDIGMQVMMIENGRIIHVANRALARQFGYTDDDLDGCTALAGIVHPDDRDRGLDYYRRRLAGEAVSPSCELGLVTRDGERREYEVAIAIVPGTEPVRVVTIGRDITARMRMEASLRESRTILAEVQRIAHIGSWNRDFVNSVLDWSDEICSIFEINAERLGASCEPFLGAIHPDDREAVSRAYTESLATRGPYAIEYRLMMPDGRVKYVYEHCKTSYDAEGHPLRSIGTVQDITERKLAELLLYNERSRLKAFFRAIPDLAWLKDTEGTYLACNHVMEEFFGAAEADIVGKTDFDFVSAELAAFFRQKDMDAMATGEACTNEEWITFAIDGRRVLLETIKIPVYNAHGDIEGVLGIGRDITEHKRVEEQLAASGREFRTLAENLPDVIVRYDRACRRIYVNAQYLRVNGPGSGSGLGKSPEERSWKIAPIAADYQRWLKETLERGESGSFDLHWREPDGRKVIYEVRAIPEFAMDGQVASLLTIARDVTAVKEAESRLKAHEREFRRLEDLAGRRPTEVPGVSEAEFFQKRVEEVLETGIADEFEHAVQTAEGTTLWSLVSILPEHDESGRVVHAQMVARDITVLKEAQRFLEVSRAQLSELAARRGSEQESERKRLAWEVHEGIGQYLMALHMNLSMLQRLCGADDQERAERIRAMFEMVEKSVEIVRKVAWTLRPHVLDLGLVAALEWLTDKFSRDTGIPCDAMLPDGAPQLEEDVAVAIFRVAEEALANVARHAGTEMVELSLHQNGDYCYLTIRDDGNGFDLSRLSDDSVVGLAWLREQYAALGGELNVNSVPGRGTVIEAIVRTEWAGRGQ